MDVKAFLEGLMESNAGDVVRLAHMDAPTARQLRRLDLRLLSEYERKPGGAVRVKLLDRATLAATLCKDGDMVLNRGSGGGMASFIAAMQAAAFECADDLEE